jgi:nucleotide-binding universal stress UspA family protein
MALLSRILVPVEFSPRCMGSAHYAEALACHSHSELAFLHVIVPPPLSYSAPDVMAYATAVDLDTDLQDQAQTQLDAFAVVEPANARVTRVVMEGDPARIIVEYAREGHFNLVVMPTHGYGPLRRFLHGSVTARVLHDAQCPVWTGPHMESAPSYDSVSFRTVLCALDLQPESREVLQWAVGFVREFGGKLHLLHVVHPSASSVGGFYFDPDWHADLARQARADIADLQTDLQADGEVSIETGELPAAIRETAERLHADLVVIGRGRHARLLGRLRANAYAILRESPCPVAAV